ncbi:MAG: ATP-grasp domain-containing protein [Methanoregulaceae archaeon]|nr:ATP-grasp domain-containing protein [Methanoregulaceae archaeon]
MIYIVKKPTDAPGDDSTGAVVRELRRSGSDPLFLDLDRMDPFSAGLKEGVVWICGLRQDEHQIEVVRALALAHRVINDPEAIMTCASKVLTTALLIAHDVPSPDTCFTASAETAAAFLRKHGRSVYKPVYGFDGLGIRFVSTPADLGEPPYYLQEYIRNDRDYRVFVLGGEAVGAIARSGGGELAHNIHQGGDGAPVTPDGELAATAEAAAFAVGTDYAGVDLLETPGGYTVLEVNGTPNWHCMSAPIPTLLAAYLREQEEEIHR